MYAVNAISGTNSMQYQRLPKIFEDFVLEKKVSLLRTILGNFNIFRRNWCHIRKAITFSGQQISSCDSRLYDSGWIFFVTF